ncbi:MAG: hypothetical protein AAGJ87_03375, partial [Pseudomonadota bacterium]
FAFFPAQNTGIEGHKRVAVDYTVVLVTAPQTKFRIKLRRPHSLTPEQNTSFGFDNIDFDETERFNGNFALAETDLLIMDVQSNSAYLWQAEKEAEFFATDAAARPPRAIKLIDRGTGPRSFLSAGDGLVYYFIRLSLESGKCSLTMNGSDSVELPDDRCAVKELDPGDPFEIDLPSLLIAASSKDRGGIVNGFCVGSAFAIGTYEPLE